MLRTPIGAKRGLIVGTMMAGLFLVIACSFTAEIVENTATPVADSLRSIQQSIQQLVRPLDAVVDRLAVAGQRLGDLDLG